MFKRILLSCLCIALFAVSPSFAQEGKKAADPDIKALMTKIVAAWNSMDPSQAAPFYSKDPKAVFYDAAPLKYTGWQEYAAGSAAMFAQFASLEMALNNDLQTGHSGNMAWGTATWHGKATFKDGSPDMIADARWTLIFEKKGNDWLVVHEHLSFPFPELPGAGGEGK